MCGNAASDPNVSGTCESGNCLRYPCILDDCLPPIGTCSSYCDQCSDYYNEVETSLMTNELCIQICITQYGYRYAATNAGCVKFISNFILITVEALYNE